MNDSKGCEACNGQTPSLFRYCPICGRKLIVTNADRIRAMSDEELAAFLCSVKFRRETTPKVPDSLYIKHVYDWLQQPEKEDNDG